MKQQLSHVVFHGRWTFTTREWVCICQDCAKQLLKYDRFLKDFHSLIIQIHILFIFTQSVIKWFMDIILTLDGSFCFITDLRVEQFFIWLNIGHWIGNKPLSMVSFVLYDVLSSNKRQYNDMSPIRHWMTLINNSVIILTYVGYVSLAAIIDIVIKMLSKLSS